MKMLHENELINIEEDMILQPGYSIRSFTLHNRINRLKVTIFNIGAAITSIKTDFGKEEIIRSSVSNNDEHEWQSHVLGLDTLLLNISSTTLMYQLTSENELVVTGKFRGQQHFEVISPFYFNLNPESSTIDGHYLHVKCGSDNPECDQFPTLSVMGDEPCEFSGPQPVEINCHDHVRNKDLVYYTVGDISTLIKIKLTYGPRTVQATLRSNSQLSNPGNNINCRVRLRIRKHGISIMPALMPEFKIVYKFIW